VELLVALALIIFIMVILTEAFSAGLDTFRQLKAIGDMQERMRHVAIIMRRDLRADHFGAQNNPPARGSHLSDQDLRTLPPPDNGYFRIWQTYHQPAAATAPQVYYQGSVWEGQDSDGIPSTRATDCWMAFTVWLGLQGKGPQAYLYGGLPVPQIDPPLDAQLQGTGICPADFVQASTMSSQWGEVAYFLRPLTTSAGGTPLFALYRRQRLLAPQPQNPAIVMANVGEWPQYYEVSFPQPNGPTTQLNDPGSITVPPNRLLANPTDPLGSPSGTWTIQDLLGANAAQAGDDLLMTDVISFDIKVLQEGYDPTQAQPIGPGNFVPLFVDLPPPSLSQNTVIQAANSISMFDTWSNQAPYTTTAGQPTSLPLPIRILAIQITLRVWDERTQQTRQMTITQDM
jgi:hypothetical protein